MRVMCVVLATLGLFEERKGVGLLSGRGGSYLAWLPATWSGWENDEEWEGIDGLVYTIERIPKGMNDILLRMGMFMCMGVCDTDVVMLRVNGWVDGKCLPECHIMACG